MAGNLNGQHHGGEPLGDRSLPQKSSGGLRGAKNPTFSGGVKTVKTRPLENRHLQRLNDSSIFNGFQNIADTRFLNWPRNRPCSFQAKNPLLPIQGHPRANRRVFRPPLPVQIGHVCRQYHSSYFAWHTRLLKGLRVDFWGI
jgi:hypothetical protein